MEVLTDLKSPYPVLVPNAEVMEMLEKCVTENKERIKAVRNKKRLRKLNQADKGGVDHDEDDTNIDDDDGDIVENKFQHRDWIEERVLEYLKSTPCVNLPTSKIPEFKSILMASKRKASTIPVAATAATAAVTASHSDSKSIPAAAQRTGFALTEAESIQILNFMPQEPVEIHLMIDELHDRMSERQQQELLELVQSYNTPAGDAAASAGDDKEEGTSDDRQEREYGTFQLPFGNKEESPHDAFVVEEDEEVFGTIDASEIKDPMDSLEEYDF